MEGHKGKVLVVLIMILEIFGIGCALATSAAPQRALCGLILLAVALVGVRECLTLREIEAELRRSNDPFRASNPKKCGNAPSALFRRYSGHI